MAPGQPVKIVFTNPDATDHNLVIVKPDAMSEVGMAANEMARDPRNANSDFVPPMKRNLILHASTDDRTHAVCHMVHVLRFEAPASRVFIPYLCTFPGHWVVMNGVMVVANDPAAAEAMLAADPPKSSRNGPWPISPISRGSLAVMMNATLMRGMSVFVKARCNQCHVVAGHGVNLGPDLSRVDQDAQGRRAAAADHRAVEQDP